MTSKSATPAAQAFDLFVVCDAGTEEACKEEIQHLLPKSAPKAHRLVITLSCTLEEAVFLAYRALTARRVCIQLNEATSTEALAALAPTLDPHIKALVGEVTCKVEAEVLTMTPEGAEEPASMITQELIEEVAAWGVKALGRPVKLVNPDLVIYGLLTPERLWVGLDLVGRSLSRREWRIMVSKRSIKATIAAAIAITAKPKGTILDPFADDGSIAVETALLMTGESPRKHDKRFSFMTFPAFAGRDWLAWRKEHAPKAGDHEGTAIIAYNASMGEMKAVRTHAKLASVENVVRSTRVTVDWMDLKLEEKSIDGIITNPITSGKIITTKQAMQLAEQLFNQAAYVLKRGKTVTVLTEKPDEITPMALQHGFTVRSSNPILMGKRPMRVIVYGKEPATRKAKDR
jgi:23S rRNA G2445 N2-methylase RlmL